MTRQVNPNIGHVECHVCSELAALRRNKNGGLYYDCLSCGRIAPNHKGGQEKLLACAVVWGAAGPPDGVPKWIAENWPYSVAVRMRDHGGENAYDEENGGAAQGVQAAEVPPARAKEAAPVLDSLPPPPPKKKKPKATVKAPPNQQPRLPHVPKERDPEPPRSWLDEL